jgi:hypothetical protein
MTALYTERCGVAVGEKVEGNENFSGFSLCCLSYELRGSSLSDDGWLWKLILNFNCNHGCPRSDFTNAPSNAPEHAEARVEAKKSATHLGRRRLLQSLRPQPRQKKPKGDSEKTSVDGHHVVQTERLPDR